MHLQFQPLKSALRYLQGEVHEAIVPYETSINHSLEFSAKTADTIIKTLGKLPPKCMFFLQSADRAAFQHRDLPATFEWLNYAIKEAERHFSNQ